MAKDFLNIIAMVCAIAAAVVVARTSLLKQTIAAQESLIEALIGEKDQLARRVAYLEAVVNGDPGMVGKGHLASGVGEGRGNRPAHPKNPKNRHP
jgi:hypothetical protein